MRIFIRQVHAMLTGGARACETLLPGILAEMERQGASSFPYASIKIK
jgi:hypothetical protein